ncbi:MAG TPA: hypothetical protein VF337_00625 [Candidatus Limnocylindrales bacterium]
MKGAYRMSLRKTLAALTIMGLSVVGCDYIVPPYEIGSPTPVIVSLGWSGTVTGVAENAGALHVDLAIVNNTGDWSAMDVAVSAATLTDSAGKSSSCSTVFVGTSVFVNGSGWYLPPGFMMKGYTGGSVAEPVTQPLFVECAGVAKGTGQKLSIKYTYVTGAFNYYKTSHRYDATMSLDLSTVVTDLKYPISQSVSTLVLGQPSAPIAGINDCTVQLTNVKRTAAGFEFSWESSNPTDTPNVQIHIGQPPVLGADGILYGFYRSPHLVDPPVTPAKGTATWTTEVDVPAAESGFYVLVPVETQQNKNFEDHVIDIKDK